MANKLIWSSSFCASEQLILWQDSNTPLKGICTLCLLPFFFLTTLMIIIEKRKERTAITCHLHNEIPTACMILCLDWTVSHSVIFLLRTDWCAFKEKTTKKNIYSNDNLKNEILNVLKLTFKYRATLFSKQKHTTH